MSVCAERICVLGDIECDIAGPVRAVPGAFGAQVAEAARHGGLACCHHWRPAGRQAHSHLCTAAQTKESKEAGWGTVKEVTVMLRELAESAGLELIF